MKDQIIKKLKDIVRWSESVINVENKVDILIKQLLEIQLIYYSVKYISDGKDFPEKPESNYPNLYKEIRIVIELNFPEFKTYNTVSDVSFESENNEIFLSDPYDDLADLIIDFKEFIWYFENTSYNNGLFYFTHGYFFHWGKHISDLTYYLFHLKVGR